MRHEGSFPGDLTVRHHGGAALLAHLTHALSEARLSSAIVGAVGFAGLLVTVLSSGTVQSLLTGLVETALSY